MEEEGITDQELQLYMTSSACFNFIRCVCCFGCCNKNAGAPGTRGASYAFTEADQRSGASRGGLSGLLSAGELPADDDGIRTRGYAGAPPSPMGREAENDPWVRKDGGRGDEDVDCVAAVKRGTARFFSKASRLWLWFLCWTLEIVDTGIQLVLVVVLVVLHVLSCGAIGGSRSRSAGGDHPHSN